MVRTEDLTDDGFFGDKCFSSPSLAVAHQTVCGFVADFDNRRHADFIDLVQFCVVVDVSPAAAPIAFLTIGALNPVTTI